jgi:hypothetical protein
VCGLLLSCGLPSVAQETSAATPSSGGPTFYIAPWGSDSNSGSLQAPWATLHHASFLLQAGATIVLRGGIYVNDYLIVPSGVTGQSEPITVTAYPGEAPMLTGGGPYDTVLAIYSPTVVNGLTFFRPDDNDVVDIWSSYVTVENCTFKESGGQFVRINGVSNVTVQNNIFDTNGYIDTDGENDGIVILGSSNVLVQNNYGARNGHYFADAIYNPAFGPSKNVIFRDNTIEQHWGGGIGETGQGSENMLIENNRISHVGEGVPYIKSNLLLNASNNIVRNNILTKESGWYQNNGLVLTGQYNIKDSNAENNRIYNNVFYQIGYLPIFLSQRQHSDNDFNYVTHNKIVNNILYEGETQGAMFYSPAETAYISSETFHSPNKPWPFFPYYNYFLSNIIGNDAGNNNLFQYLTPTTYHDWTMGDVQSEYGSYISGNIEANPEFANSAGGNFELTSASPAIAAGAHLAHTTSAGTSTTVPVDDPYFFSNGFGLIPGDRVKIGNNAPVTVTAVNYASGVLTLSSAVGFHSGDPVDLANYNGAAPDLGAFEYSSSAPGVFNSSVTVENATEASISWTSGSAATGQVEYGTSSGYGQTSLLNPGLATTHAITLNGLQPNTTYHYAVISVDANGGRTVSSDETFTTPRAAGPAIGAPSVSNVHLSGSGSSATASATISWTTDEAATTQVVYNAGLWHCTYFHATRVTDKTGATGHSVTLTGLVPNATYHYAVQSSDLSGHTSYSGDLTFATPAISAPGPVISNIAVSASSGATGWFAAPHGHGFAPSGKNCCGYSFAQATISWQTNVAASHNKVLLIPISIGGSVETAELGGSTQATVSGDPAATTAPALTIYQLAPNTTYEYRVESTDSAGHTTTSPTLQFTTPAID